MEQEKVLVIDQKKCTGCKKCEIVCSVAHTGTSNPERSRIRVLKLDEIGFYLPISCQNCEKPQCTEVCPAKAAHRDLKSNKVLIDKKKCIGCKTCIISCPFGAPSFDEIERVSIKCDFCEGAPLCVAACKNGAISYMDADTISLMKRDRLAREYAKLLGTAVK
jgi:anaerobic carbon-monoxide dehydrogenase iron sulfur subunit